MSALLFLVRAGFWLATSALAIGAMTAKTGLYTFSYTLITFLTIEVDVGMFKTTAGNRELDTVKWFNETGLGQSEAQSIQAGATLGLLLTSLSFAVCAAAFACPGGFSGAFLKTFSFMTDLLAACAFVSSGSLILVAFHQNLNPIEKLPVFSISDAGDLGPSAPLLGVCAFFAVVSGCIACAIAPRRTIEHVQLVQVVDPAANPNYNTANASMRDYTTAH